MMSKTYVQKALILNGFFMLAQLPGERERTIVLVGLTAGRQSDKIRKDLKKFEILY